MENYVGVKSLKAIHMTRGDYNTKRGWTIPANENPNDEGFMVQYPDGYISWSPKAVFEDAYVKMNNEAKAKEIEGHLIALLQGKVVTENNDFHPRNIITCVEGAKYIIPTYRVTEKGLTFDGPLTMPFCKGNKTDDAPIQQTGVLSETLIQLVIDYLTSVNKGDLATRETSSAITKLDESLMWLDKRKQDRDVEEF